MDPSWQESSSSHGGEGRPHSPWPFRTFAHGAYHWGSNSPFAQDGKVSQVCRYFQRGLCFHGHRCSNFQAELALGPGEAVPVSSTFSSPHSYQHPEPPGCLQWGRRHSEPRVTLPGPLLGLTRRGSEPTYLPSVAVSQAGASWGTEHGLEGLASQNEGLGGSSWKFLPPSCESSGAQQVATVGSEALVPALPEQAAGGDHSHSQESRPKPQPVQELVASLQSLDLEREQDSRDVVCGICMDKVWDKPEAKRIFGILPNCTHAHCLGCLRAWRKRRQDFPLDVIKACPQCRVHSSYIIPHRFWVSEGAEKEQLIRNFKARTRQTPCRFFLRGNGHCPFKSDCIYLHQLPDAAPASGPPCPESFQLASGTEVLGPPVLLEDRVFTDYALAVAFWGFELLLDPNSSHHSLL